MVSGDARDTDVVGVARGGRRAAVAALLVRGGRVIGKESRLVDRASSPPTARLVATWVAQALLAPRRVLLGALPDDAGVIAEAFGQRAGRAVELTRPERGRGRQLVELAERNAAAALEDVDGARRGAARAAVAGGVRAAEGTRAARAAVSNDLLRHLELRRRRGGGGRGGGGGRPRAQVALPPHAHAPAGARRLRDDRRGGRALLDARGVGRAAAPRPGRDRRRRRAGGGGARGDARASRRATCR